MDSCPSHTRADCVSCTKDAAWVPQGNEGVGHRPGARQNAVLQGQSHPENHVLPCRWGPGTRWTGKMSSACRGRRAPSDRGGRSGFVREPAVL